MARIMMIAVLGIALTFGAAAALDVGVSGYYSPGVPFGPAAEVNELKPLGFAGDFNVGFNGNLALSLGGGYAVYKYREGPHIIPAVGRYECFEEIPIVTITMGVDYGFPIANLTPFVNAGAAAAVELAEYPGNTHVDVAPGVYAGVGVRYFFTKDLGLEVGPRYALLFDNPAVEQFDPFSEPVYAEEHSQLLNLRFGLSYLF